MKDKDCEKEDCEKEECKSCSMRDDCAEYQLHCERMLQKLEEVEILVTKETPKGKFMKLAEEFCHNVGCAMTKNQVSMRDDNFIAMLAMKLKPVEVIVGGTMQNIIAEKLTEKKVEFTKYDLHVAICVLREWIKDLADDITENGYISNYRTEGSNNAV